MAAGCKFHDARDGKKLPARNDGFAMFDFSTAAQSIDPDQSA
jgi:hypothetical protein